MRSTIRQGHPQSERELVVAWLFVIIYIAVFTILSVVRFNTLHASTYDLGIFTQVIWNTAQGQWFETSLGRSNDVSLVGSYLGNHVRPIFLLLAPTYHLWPDPRQLLILQSVALGVAGIYLYRIACRQIGSPTPALIVTLCYLLYPALGFLNLIDFHPIALTIPLIFLAYWAQLDGKQGLFWGAIVLALATKEEMVIPIGAWGLVTFLQRDKRWSGIWMMALSGIWAYLSFGVIIPHFQGRAYRFWEMWDHIPGFRQLLGNGRGETSLLSHLSPGMTILWLTHLFLPLGFLPILGPSFVVALPSLSYLLLGEESRLRTVGVQYPAVLIPWFFLAIVEGLRWLDQTERHRLYRLGLFLMFAGSIGTNVILNPILRQAQSGTFRRDPHHEEMITALEMIPADASVSTINRLGPPLANRRVLVSFELPAPFRLDHVVMADYVLLNLVDCHSVDVRTSNKRLHYAEMIASVLETRRYRVRYWSDRILLLERGTPSDERVDAVLEYVDKLVEENRPCWP